MKKFNLQLFVLLILSINARSQVASNDSVTMNPNYQDDVFYSFYSGTKTPAMINNWDLAFCINNMDVAIRVNDVNGVNLYAVPGTDTSGWATLDSSGFQNWQELHNSDTMMFTGAFNINGNGGGFDFSWGVYDLNTHEVVGDSLFLIKVTDLQGNVFFKKLWIIKRADNPTHDWVFRYANLDNTGDTTVSIPATNYSTKNFIYYSITTASIIDREPANTDWDILFTRYSTDIGGGVFYPVAGVFSNFGVQVADVRPVDISTINSDSAYSSLYNTNLTEIGYDWKTFNMSTFMWDIEDSLVYFVRTNAGEVYKLVMTGFDGSATGNIYFNKTLIFTTAVNEIENDNLKLLIFPNPVSDFLNAEFISSVDGKFKYNICDMTGRLIKSEFMAVQNGLNKLQLDISCLSSGLYTFELFSGDKRINKKLIKL